MDLDFERMRSELNEFASARSIDRSTGGHTSESFKYMVEIDNNLQGNLHSECLIPRNDGNGDAIVVCNGSTTKCPHDSTDGLKPHSQRKPSQGVEIHAKRHPASSAAEQRFIRRTLREFPLEHRESGPPSQNHHPKHLPGTLPATNATMTRSET